MQYIMIFILLFGCLWGTCAQAADQDREAIYFELRQMVLDLKDEPPADQGEHPIYAAVVDMDIDGVCATLACVADGSTSLYYQYGGGMIGLGQSENVAQAAQAFLFSSEQVLEILSPVDSFPLPKNGEHIVYLVGANTVYACELDPNTIHTAKQEIQFLFALYQNVISEISKHL